MTYLVLLITPSIQHNLQVDGVVLEELFLPQSCLYRVGSVVRMNVKLEF